MTFSLSIFLYLYYAFLIIWLFFFLTGIYHMLKFGFKSLGTLLFTAFFTAIAVFILATSFNYINQIDWQVPISVFQGFNINQPPVF